MPVVVWLASDRIVRQDRNECGVVVNDRPGSSIGCIANQAGNNAGNRQLHRFCCFQRRIFGCQRSDQDAIGIRWDSNFAATSRSDPGHTTIGREFKHLRKVSCAAGRVVGGGKVQHDRLAGRIGKCYRKHQLIALGRHCVADRNVGSWIVVDDRAVTDNLNVGCRASGNIDCQGVILVRFVDIVVDDRRSDLDMHFTSCNCRCRCIGPGCPVKDLQVACTHRAKIDSTTKSGSIGQAQIDIDVFNRKVRKLDRENGEVISPFNRSHIVDRYGWDIGVVCDHGRHRIGHRISRDRFESTSGDLVDCHDDLFVSFEQRVVDCRQCECART